VLQLLLDAGADVAACDDYLPWVPEEVRASHSAGIPDEHMLVLVRALLQRDPSRVDSRHAVGRTPLMLMLRHRNLPMAQPLLEAGASVSTVDRYGAPALLHLLRPRRSRGERTALGPMREALRLLLGAGADPLAMDEDETVLMRLVSLRGASPEDYPCALMIGDVVESVLRGRDAGRE
jgi:ankyrin repeat protein